MEPKLKHPIASLKSAHDAGITLVELLVVTAVMAVLAVGVSLTAIRSSARAATSDLEWFRTQFETQRSLATQERTTRGLTLSSKGLATSARRGERWSNPSAPRAWRGKVTLGRTEPRSSFDEPDIFLLANGQTTAFEVHFAIDQSKTHTCSSDGWARLKCSTD